LTEAEDVLQALTMAKPRYSEKRLLPRDSRAVFLEDVKFWIFAGK
jgi:hypothetical protein